ncbi:MAG: response regulator [Chloroflexi bacterium]|nr:response regulator [Chloroflexota bacterium]
MNTAYGHILVVEDVPNILELLDITLRFKGYKVITARNGEEALECIRVQLPALVITDILMPKMDGFSFVQKLRTDSKTMQIPVIFLSATYVTPEDKAFAMSLGASRFIEKPIDTEDFLLTVAELLVEGLKTAPRPLAQHDFYLGYRARLENKLRHKRSQITRAQRLIPTLPAEQQESYRSLLDQAARDRDEIEAELKELHRILDELQK